MDKYIKGKAGYIVMQDGSYAYESECRRADFDDSLIYKEFGLPENKRTIPSEQIMRKESLEVLKEWEKNDCKVEY
ncbi:MAG: hypothetical protein IMY69_08160 [Bacteroidetes bacterium]|nr:hypothetical protein [Bacteroidota bacterium]